MSWQQKETPYFELDPFSLGDIFWDNQKNLNGLLGSDGSNECTDLGGNIVVM